MSKKKLYNKTGIVFSTAPDFEFKDEEDEMVSLPPKEQLLKVVLDKKHRGGKTVTLIKGFVMKEDDAEALAKQLKSYCGSGGSAKDNEIIIQGDHTNKIVQWLVKEGYTKTRKI
ncbi:MAG TPA: translation initiation factor [Hanamia sp.]